MATTLRLHFEDAMGEKVTLNLANVRGDLTVQEVRPRRRPRRRHRRPHRDGTHRRLRPGAEGTSRPRPLTSLTDGRFCPSRERDRFMDGRFCPSRECGHPVFSLT